MGEIFYVESVSGRYGRYVLSDKRYTSFESDLRMVVLPELSNPKTNILTSSFFVFLRLFKMPPMPLSCVFMPKYKSILVLYVKEVL